MAADARVPCVAKPSAAIILARWNRLVMVFHEEGFQLPGSFQCEGMIQIVNTKLAHKYSLLMHRIKIPANFYMEWIKRFCGWIYHFSISLTLAALQRQKSLPDIGDTTIQDATSLSSGLPLWSLASTPWVMSLYFKFRAIYFSDLSKTGHFIENASYILSWVTKKQIHWFNATDNITGIAHWQTGSQPKSKTALHIYQALYIHYIWLEIALQHWKT